MYHTHNIFRKITVKCISFIIKYLFFVLQSFAVFICVLQNFHQFMIHAQICSAVTPTCTCIPCLNQTLTLFTVHFSCGNSLYHFTPFEFCHPKCTRSGSSNLYFAGGFERVCCHRCNHQVSSWKHRLSQASLSLTWLRPQHMSPCAAPQPRPEAVSGLARLSGQWRDKAGGRTTWRMILIKPMGSYHMWGTSSNSE